ncbi:cellulase family glycosylhydrolase [Ruminococcus sp.]|uniref:cellulase family glycosylhydrolase n=1 Tax=Ruminococcus sp. TaxID=41978 RepID=UPI001B60E4A8|nr:cellulase family glycosylhydrolase [Ruminococcus sp.]MBP5432742.1 cellulase family glycosylhydrolase [Ruminococcus sp.]
MAKHILTRLLAGLAATAMLVPAVNSIPAAERTVAAADDCNDDWLHVNDKAQIVDKDGNEVWLTGVNWFGYNVGSQVFDGAWSANVHHCLDLIADHGFNLLRVPMSTEIILQWKNKKPDPIIKLNEYENPELTIEGEVGGTPMYSFDIWNKVVEWCKEDGLKIMMDIHCATSNSAGHNVPLWYDDNYSTKDWLDALSWFTDYYKNDDTIIAIDLKNEPHGKPEEGKFAKWDDSKDQNNWKYAAEQGAMACLNNNPNLLIMVEGVECYPKFEEGADWSTPSVDYANYDKPSKVWGAWWGANLRGVKDHPVDIGQYNKQIVYSPHDYGPGVWEQKWFYLDDPNKTFTRQTLLDDYWYGTWAYLVEENMYPLLIGEWGGFVDKEHDTTGENVHWLTELRDYMIDKHIHHTFWCFNENSSDTGGLVYDNFQKWDDVKYEFVKPALWQTNDGKFISLDHQIPLGTAGNGITLSDYYSGSSTPTTRPTTTTSTGTTTSVTTTSEITTTTSSSETTTTTTSSDTTTTTSETTTTTTTFTTTSTTTLTHPHYNFNSVISYPTKTVYTEGEKLDVSGFVFAVTSSSGEETTYDYKKANGEVESKVINKDGNEEYSSKFNTLPAGEYTVKIIFAGLHTQNNVCYGIDCSYKVTIEPKNTNGSGPNDDILWGDANCDGGIDMADAVLIMQSLANPNKYGVDGSDSKHITSKGQEQADVDTATKGITSNDALQIQLFLLGKIKSLVPNG